MVSAALMQNRIEWLGPEQLSGILTLGGTILGTSRDKPHKMPIGGKTRNMMDVMVENYQRHDLEALICVGGGGTAKNAWRLAQQGLNVVCLPKTIDNDVSGTDVTFGFDTAVNIASEAIDRLHSNRAQPSPHHRCRDHGAQYRLAGFGRWLGRRGGCHPHPRDSLQYRVCGRIDTGAQPRRHVFASASSPYSEGAMTQRVGKMLKGSLRARVEEAEA